MKALEEKNIIVAKVFIMFLKANNAFMGYKRATSDNDSHSTFQYFLKNPPKTYGLSECKWSGFIFNAFIWGNTIECKRDVNYWTRLNNRWLNILYILKNNDYEISEDISRAILSRGN